MPDMSAITLPIISGKILVVGPIYDKIDKLSVVEKMISQYKYIIFNSGLCYPSNIDKIKLRIQRIQSLIDKNKIIYLAGRTDYTILKSLTKDNKNIVEWINNKPNIAIINFPNYTVLIVDGGIPITIKSISDLKENIEVSFISQINEIPWHLSYNGGLGYVISNNPLTNNCPKYYNYSMQLGSSYSEESSVYAQEMDEIGLKQTILL